MSFWRRVFRRGEPSEADAQPVAAPEPPVDRQAEETARAQAEELARLRHVGASDGAEPSEALMLLRRYEGTVFQTRVLHALLEGLGRAGDEPAFDALRVACGGLLAAQGERERALALVAPSRSVEAMMLAAELFAASGDMARAVGTVERVLARNIDTPGAGERHERWSAQLGLRLATAPTEAGATVVGPPRARTSATFRLLREVARGGAGTVYQAEDEVLGRRLAFKVHHRVDDDRAQIEREARTAVRLRGPGVLRIYDMSPTEGWIATEWIERGSLRDILKSGRVGEVLPLGGWLPQLLRAVERVHAADLVHGDLKPANVLFRSPDDPVLGDFGICLPRGETSLSGTPGYLSPERLAGGAADPRDDVYAFGRIIEDVLAAREDAALEPALLESTSEDARHWARLALACLAPADERPANATAVQALG
jgi:serine/threonine-protein kinase